MEIKNRYTGAVIRTVETLVKADLYRANLSKADLSEADLRESNLSEANLSGADLYGADLYGANLRGVNLSGADLRWADLRGANLYGAKIGPKTVNMFQIVPQVGSFRAFKKLRNGTICELEIPATSRRVGGLVGRKCRASEAKVISGNGVSHFDPNFIYKKGGTVKVADFDPDPGIECSRGIHFFLTRSEAEAFVY